jgi:hypothetical protein
MRERTYSFGSHTLHITDAKETDSRDKDRPFTSRPVNSNGLERRVSACRATGDACVEGVDEALGCEVGDYCFCVLNVGDALEC